MDQLKKEIPFSEARAIIALPKHFYGDVEWQEDPAGSEFFVAKFLPTDENQITLPRLSIELLYRRGVVNGQCKCLFTLFEFRDNKLRAYQLEVIPQDLSKHREKGIKIYGPHKHIGERVEKVERPDLCCDDHEKWFKHFLAEANIQHHGKYFPPNPPDPQMLLGL